MQRHILPNHSDMDTKQKQLHLSTSSSNDQSGFRLCYGNQPSTNSDLLIPLQNLQESIPSYDQWQGLMPLAVEPSASVFHNDDYLLAVIASNDLQTDDMSASSYTAYSRIFQLMQKHGYPQLLRTWSYFPNITEGDQIDAYQQFCSGRSQAYQEYAFNSNEPEYPAATVIGHHATDFQLYFIAAKQAGISIQNPRQVNAFNYPASYSKDAPLFARALLHTTATQHVLFISGTASITGHETQHQDQALAQLQECLCNIEQLLITAEQHHFPKTALENMLQLKVYIKHAEDYAELRAALATRLGALEHVQFFHADMCRRDLLVEIEAIAIQPVCTT
ncbi:MAG: Rid family hydrolase [Gammaproteobacteria bacterium]|nr:Rid family hydrolase [Gammaproteobacteria bacterium]